MIVFPAWPITTSKLQLLSVATNIEIIFLCRMPYTVAVIYEVLRFANLIPVVTHQSSTDTTFEGYHIPKVISQLKIIELKYNQAIRGADHLLVYIFQFKDAVVIAALSGVHRNPKYWARPYEFYPEHFLDEEGKLRQDVEGFFPFSTGITNSPKNKSAENI